MKNIRKAMTIILIAVMVLSQMACSNTSKQTGKQDGIVIPKPNEEAATLTILINPMDYGNLKIRDFYTEYVKQFEQDFGVKIEYQEIGDAPGRLTELEEYDEYMKELSTKLYVKDGAELIFSDIMDIEPVISQGAAAKLNEKVPNSKNIYLGLLDDEIFFLPIAIEYFPKCIDKEALATTGYSIPELDWTSKDAYDIRAKWLKANKVYFNGHEWAVMFQHIVNLDKAYNSISKKLELNTPSIKQSIKDLRNFIFNGNYIVNKNYHYENYYKMFYEENSSESIESYALYDKNVELGHIDGAGYANLLKADDVELRNKKNGTIMLPGYTDREIMLEACGFAVNKNGRNLELAYEFINGLLDKEVQLNIYHNDEFRYYPVNKNIESDIRAYEAEKVKDQRVIDTKEYVLNQLKTKKFKLYNTADMDFSYLKYMIEKDLSAIILADTEYTDAELSAELKGLEDKYNIFLNE